MCKIQIARLLLVFTITVSLGSSQSPATLAVQGVDGAEIRLSAADLAALPQHTFTVTDHDKPATFQGVSLMDVCAKVGTHSGEALKGKLLAAYLLVEAADGFRAVFSLPELDASFTTHAVYLVTSRDGEPLSDTEGPFRLIAIDDKRPSRWVRQVTALRVKMAN